MTTGELLWAFLAVFALLFGFVCFIKYKKTQKKANAITQSIEAFLQTGIQTEFDTAENELAKLQNTVADLETQYLFQQRKSQNLLQKNVDFISDVSHQLKTPLAGLRLYTELEHETRPNAHTQKELQLIEKMENMIYKLLQLEKLQSETYHLEFQPIALEQVIQNVFEALKPLYPQKQFLCKGTASVRADAFWMNEAISNVIKNAAEHTKPDGKIEVRLEKSEQSVLLSVLDNGTGIPPQDFANLFERFHKTDSQTGAGLGLAITKAILEKHHGIVPAENIEGGFKITMCMPQINGYITL